MTSPRTYRAACPNCGAPVEFRSAGSAMAVCAYCSSTLLRDGDTLQRIGVVAELFDDHSPITLGADGRLPASFGQRFGQPADAGFIVTGRLQYRYADGVWSEWSLLFDDGSRLWLSEDNGRYALSQDIGAASAAIRDVPAFGQLSDGSLAPGRPLSLGRKRFEISSIVRVTVCSALGELPASARRVADELSASAAAASADGSASAPAPTDSPGSPSPAAAPAGPRQPPAPPGHWIVEARSADAQIASIDYADPAEPTLTIGVPVELADLGWRDLQAESEKTLNARSFSCPSCGGPVTVKLTGTQSIVCPACSSVIDLSSGEGAALQHYRQQRRFESPIPLGSTGRLFDVDWQTVGFARREGNDLEGSRFAWSEVLLYHPTEGFAFIVVASDGVSFVRTIAGVPELVGERTARYDGRQFRLDGSYGARVDYVEGEFYWRVRRNQGTLNADYVSGDRLLSREEERIKTDAPRGAPDGFVQGEVVWSYGRRVSASTVAKAFGLASLPTGPAAGTLLDGIDAPAYDPDDMPLGLGTRQSLGSPTSGSAAIYIKIIIVLIVLFLAFLFARSGGSARDVIVGSGGYSGSHK